MRGRIPQFLEPERREFVRIRIELPVKYKFLSQAPGFVSEEVYDGVTSNLSGGGLLLVGPLPNLDWITGLLMERICIGVNLFLPGSGAPVKALTRTAWIEALDERVQRCSIGLRFKEITKENVDHIYEFVIKAQIP